MRSVQGVGEHIDRDESARCVGRVSVRRKAKTGEGTDRSILMGSGRLYVVKLTPSLVSVLRNSLWLSAGSSVKPPA